ncbi:hypothetical protein PFISCL1PPCAC_25391, partial [Pristionchus fissidentatus]
ESFQSAMERLYQETHVLLQQTHFAMGHFEQARNESEGQNLARGVYEQLRSLDEHIGRLDVFVSKEPATRRHTVRMKVDGIKSEVRAAHLAMNSLHSRITTRWRAAADREELMSTRFRPNETSLTMEDHELQMNHRLVGSNRSVDDLLSQGQAVLDNLHAQHSSLRGVKRRFMDVGARLGLSNTTMSMIERRVSEDYMILIAGCIVTLIFMYAFYRFWHG